MKSSVKMLVCGLLASTVWTGQRTVQAHPVTGPFVGLSGNAFYGRMKKSSKAKECPEFKFDDKAQGGFAGGVGGFAGYGVVFDNGFYLGGEFNGDFLFGGECKNSFSILLSAEEQMPAWRAETEDLQTHTEKKSRRPKRSELREEDSGGVPASLVTKPRWTCGAVLQLGYAVTPQCVIYGGGGVSLQGLKTKIQISDQDLVDKKTKQNCVFTGTFRLGVRYWMTENVFLGLEGEAMLFGKKEKWSLPKATGNEKDEEAKRKPKLYNDNAMEVASVMGVVGGDSFTEKMSRQNYGGRLCIGYKF